MLIKETIERECCKQEDFRTYCGIKRTPEHAYFCIHCGQLWKHEKYMDAAGSMDIRITKIELKF